MYTVVGIVVAALVCGVIGGGIVLYCLRQGKRRREKLKGVIYMKTSSTYISNVRFYTKCTCSNICKETWSNGS